jgi:hypothetical protein
VGAARYVKESEEFVELVPPVAVTLTSTVPAPPEGEVAVIEVDEFTVKLAVVEPNRTDVTPVKPVPVMVTVVPPLVGLRPGETPVTVGAAT